MSTAIQTEYIEQLSEAAANLAKAASRAKKIKRLIVYTKGVSRQLKKDGKLSLYESLSKTGKGIDSEVRELLWEYIDYRANSVKPDGSPCVDGHPGKWLGKWATANGVESAKAIEAVAEAANIDIEYSMIVRMIFRATEETDDLKSICKHLVPLMVKIQEYTLKAEQEELDTKCGDEENSSDIRVGKYGKKLEAARGKLLMLHKMLFLAVAEGELVRTNIAVKVAEQRAAQLAKERAEKEASAASEPEKKKRKTPDAEENGSPKKAKSAESEPTNDESASPDKSSSDN